MDSLSIANENADPVLFRCYRMMRAATFPELIHCLLDPALDVHLRLRQDRLGVHPVLDFVRCVHDCCGDKLLLVYSSSYQIQCLRVQSR